MLSYWDECLTLNLGPIFIYLQGFSFHRAKVSAIMTSVADDISTASDEKTKFSRIWHPSQMIAWSYHLIL